MSDAPERGFDDTEFLGRTTRAQTLMARRGLDGLLLMTEAEVRYFSGFHTLFWQSPTRPWFLFVPASGKPIAIIPEIGADLMRKTWLSDIRTWSAPRPSDDGVSLLMELLSGQGKTRKRIGIPKGHETSLRMPLADYERLTGGLPQVEFIDATALVRDLRMVKSDAEIQKLAHIAKIGSRSFARIPEILHQNQPLEELFRAFRREGLAQGADDVPYLVGGADTGGYHDVISPPSRRPLMPSDIVMLDTGMTWDGYFCDFDRNFAVGQADESSRRAYDVLWRATEAGLTQVRPGMTCAELFQVMADVTREMDESTGDVGRFGHGLGMQLTEWPSLAAFDQTVIEENMVLTLEPSLGYGNGRIMVHEENIVIRAHGAELLTERANPELPILKG